MKAQKIGFVVGLNVAAACLIMQGCKATKVSEGPEVEQAKVVDQQASTQPAGSQSGHWIFKKNQEPVAKPVAVAPVEPAPVPTATAKVTPVASEPVAPAPTVKPVSATPAPVAPKTATVAKVEATPAPAATSYTIQKGDTLSGISKRYNVKMSAILAANPGLEANKIRIGKKINVPGAGSSVATVAKVEAAPAPAAKKAAPTMVAAAPAPAADAANLKAPTKTKPAFKPYEGAVKDYTVKNGDSLGKIASENGITIRALKELNGLKKDMVRVGQKMKIPAEKVVAVPAAAKVEAKKPEAKKAEAPAAEKKDVTVPEKKDAPKAEAAAPAAAVPAAKVEEPAAAAVPAPAAEVAAPAPAKVEEAPAAAAPAEAAKEEAPAAGARTHVVKEGEDLVSIAIQYAVSPSALMELNNLKVTDTPKPGQVLKLPASATKGE